MWSLGCIFSDMFISLTPIFQVIEPRDLVFRFIEVLGLPERCDDELMEPQMFESLKLILEGDEKEGFYEGGEKTFVPLLPRLLESLAEWERAVLSNLLVFDPKKRCTCTDLLSLEELWEAKLPKALLKIGNVGNGEFPNDEGI